MCSHKRLSIAVLVVAALPMSLQAQNFNIDFGDYFGTPTDAFGAVSGQTGRWNTVGLGTTYNLENISTAPTAASITVTATTSRGYGNGCTWGSDDNYLIGDNFYIQQGVWTLTLEGLANGRYEVFIYAPNNGSVGSGTMLINGIAVPEIPGEIFCGMTDGYGSTSLEVDVTGGTLLATGDSAGTWYFYAGLAGLQLRRSPRIFTEGFESGGFGDWKFFPP